MHDLTALLDRESIRDNIIRVARGEDRRDGALISESFWPDAHIDFGIFSGTFPEYLDYVVPGSPAIPVTAHTLGQTMIELNGDVALTETHVVAYHRVDTGTEERDTVIGARYLDRSEKRAGEWRIATRTMLYDWFQDQGVSVDISQGVMGMPFSSGHFAGKAVGDHSVEFFDGALR